MNSISTSNNTPIYYPDGEEQAAEELRQASEECAALIQSTWGLQKPEDLHIYLMTSLNQFVFNAAPPLRRVIAGITWPFWFTQWHRVWPHAGGWVQEFGKRVAVGIKPARMIAESDSALGALVFISEPDKALKYRQVVCHELTHAYSSHLNLPDWLYEGLSMLTADRLSGKQTVKNSSLVLLGGTAGEEDNETAQVTAKAKIPKAMIYIYVRGYWLTRYVAEQREALLKSLLTQRTTPEKVNAKIAAAEGWTVDEFWREINKRLVGYFEG